MIRIAPLASREIEEFCARYQCHPIFAELLLRKNITNPPDLLYFMEREHLHYTHNPLLLPDIKKAVTVIQEIADKRGTAMVFGDKDVDGITSTALLVNFLRSCGITTQYRVPEGNDRYGLSIEAVRDAVSQNSDIIIAVDCGSTQLEEIAFAQEHGIPVLVIDHHELRDTLPKAAAIVNPKRHDSRYPCKETCTCTLVAKLIFAHYLLASSGFMQNVLLLHSVPGQNIHICDGIILHAGVQQDRVHGLCSKDSIDAVLEKAYHDADVILVYDANRQNFLLEALENSQGKKPIISCKEKFAALIPQLETMSITELCAHAHAQRYAESFEEIDMLCTLFRYASFTQESKAVEKFTECLDLVALATIADMVSVSDENRILLHKGLEVLGLQQRDAISLLAKKGLLELPVDGQRIPWTLTPTINATGRMGEASVAVQLFLDATSAEDKKEALTHAIALNKKRRALFETALWEHQKQASESLEELHEKCIFIASPSIHRGITGIVANRIAEQHQKPCICIAIGDSICTGSVRSLGMLNTPRFLENFSDLFTGWGGHHDAGGFSCYTEDFPRLKTRLVNFIRRELYLSDNKDSFEPDCILPEKYLTPAIMSLLDDCKPFGSGFRAPWFQIDGMKIVEVKQRGNNKQHYLLLLEGGGYKWPAVYWNVALDIQRILLPGARVSIVCTIAYSVFREQRKIQLTIQAIEHFVDSP